MLSYYVIPFFLVAKLPSPPYNEDFSPEYTFETRLTTTAVLNNQKNEPSLFTTDYDVKPAKSVMNRHIITMEFKCRTYDLNALLCYKGKHKQYSMKTRNLFNITDEYRKTLFQIRFNENGVTDYTVERTDNDTMQFLLNLYRFFGSQLNIGTETDLDNEISFQTMENSAVGLCPTFFNIKHLKYNSKKHALDDDVFLLPDYFDDFQKKDIMIRIFKRRYVQDCFTITNYIFANSLLDEFLPDYIEENMISSHSLMTLSTYHFESKTQNVFNLYDLNMNMIGNVAETIKVVLKSVEPPKHFPSRIFLKPILSGVFEMQHK